MNLGEKLKPCPFCGRKMVFVLEKGTNRYGFEFVRKYYTHDNSDKSKPICFLDELKYQHPFFKIDAEDAEPNVGYIGQYAEKWNMRVE